MIDHIITQGFMRDGDRGILTVVEDLNDVLPALRNAPTEKFDPSSKWI